MKSDYRICSAPTLEALEKEVQKSIKEGFEPVGGVSYFTAAGSYGKTTFFQSMVQSISVKTPVTKTYSKKVVD